MLGFSLKTNIQKPRIVYFILSILNTNKNHQLYFSQLFGTFVKDENETWLDVQNGSRNHSTIDFESIAGVM